MSILLIIHSITRWLAILVALALVIRLVLGMIKKLPFDKNAAALTSAFGGLMDTQLLLGGVFFVADGLTKTGFPLFRWEHSVVMLLAASVAHLPSMWKKKADDVRTRNTLIAVVVCLLLIFAGVSFLDDWTSRWHIFGLF
jgi:hypothetical protein